jgi:hypothetical protein
LDFFHRSSLSGFTGGYHEKLAAVKEAAATWAILINRAGATSIHFTMGGAGLEEKGHPFLPAEFHTEGGKMTGRVAWVKLHGVEKHAITAHTAGGAES